MIKYFPAFFHTFYTSSVFNYDIIGIEPENGKG